jgi:scyllo-inositol 2-dehydrogenase (NAD+)
MINMNVALLSKWHVHAVDYAREAQENDSMIEGQEVRIKSRHLGTDEWVKPELPESLSTAMEQWTAAIKTGKPPFITEEDILNLTAINEAAARSSYEGRRVLLSELEIKQEIQ